jgi:hypothetical protein
MLAYAHIHSHSIVFHSEYLVAKFYLAAKQKIQNIIILQSDFIAKDTKLILEFCRIPCSVLVSWVNVSHNSYGTVSSMAAIDL